MSGAPSTEMNQRFGEFLLETKKIDRSDMERAFELQRASGIRFGNALVRLGAISEDSLLQEMSQHYDIPIIEYSDVPDTQTLYGNMTSFSLNFDWFVAKEIVAWAAEKESVIKFVGRDPFDPLVTEVLRKFFPGKRIVKYLTPSFLLEKLLEDLNSEHSANDLFSAAESRHLRELAEEAPVVEFVNNLIAQAVDHNASDIHIEPQEKTFKVRLRVDGVLQDHLSQPLDRFAAVASRIKLISGLDIAERRLPQDGRMSTRMSGASMDIRVSSAPCVHGESVVMRLLPKEKNQADLSLLGMEDDHLTLMKGWAAMSSGIILVTGPTGSGKSTTLHAALETTNDGQRKIITVEDPVELRVPGITQIQAHEEIGYTFANALRAILRQDPDVIMIGEIRDLETAEIAIQAALSGHLVLSTLHTNDALSAFARLIDMGVERFLVAAPVKGVQAQRLVRRVCSSCAEITSEPENLSGELCKIAPKLLGSSWKSAVGCAKCQGTGYSGRIGIYEMIPIGSEIQDAVVNGGTTNDLRQLASSAGRRNLFLDGLVKASKGETTLDEIYRVIATENS